MTTSDIILVIAIFAFVLLTQVGRRAFDRRRIVLTLAVVGGVGGGYVGTDHRTTRIQPSPPHLG